MLDAFLDEAQKDAPEVKTDTTEPEDPIKALQKALDDHGDLRVINQDGILHWDDYFACFKIFVR